MFTTPEGSSSYADRAIQVCIVVEAVTCLLGMCYRQSKKRMDSLMLSFLPVSESEPDLKRTQHHYRYGQRRRERITDE